MNDLTCNHSAKYHAYYYNYFYFLINWFVSSKSAFHYILIGFTELWSPNPNPYYKMGKLSLNLIYTFLLSSATYPHGKDFPLKSLSELIILVIQNNQDEHILHSSQLVQKFNTFIPGYQKLIFCQSLNHWKPQVPKQFWKA